MNKKSGEILLNDLGRITEKTLTTSCRSVHPNERSKVALFLRENVMNAEKAPLPESLTLKNIFKGEVQVPSNVSLFFKYLIAGPDSRKWKQTIKQKLVSSISQDTMYVATPGLKKSRKHLIVGLALNSLTGSTKVIETMSRLGHCISYHTIKEIENEMTTEAKKV